MTEMNKKNAETLILSPKLGAKGVFEMNCNYLVSYMYG